MLKKRYLFLMIIVCLFSISAVSANEMDNTTDYGNNDFNQFSDETNYQSIEENSILSSMPSG